MAFGMEFERLLSNYPRIYELPLPCPVPKTELAAKRSSIKRAALYACVSTCEQNTETQMHDLREMARQRGYEIVYEYSDIISGAKSKRVGLDKLLADARRHRFDVVLVAAFDRVARSVRHFLEVLDGLNHLGIEFIRFRENIDTGAHLVVQWS